MFSVAKIIEKPAVRDFLRTTGDEAITKFGHFIYRRYSFYFGILFKVLDQIESRLAAYYNHERKSGRDYNELEMG